jgi:hypothetical protein
MADSSKSTPPRKVSPQEPDPIRLAPSRPLPGFIAPQLAMHLFDLLHLDGHDLTKVPLVARKRALQGLLASLGTDGPIRYSEHLVGNGPAAFKHPCGLGLEGIVSKLEIRDVGQDS